ncbi:hypothetical protein NIES2101_21915 [Calothrix sp. HK-06]|nr:hypothetical protein NIES2101_21915 [Calothrix sp. HK-06]
MAPLITRLRRTLFLMWAPVAVFILPFIRSLPLNDADVASSEEVRYNAWGKPTTKKSINDAITRMQQLQ